MKNMPFSLNIDESTSKGNKKRVLNILVCFFCEEAQKSVTHLYSSVELTVVNAETVFQALMQELRKDGIPLENIVSILTDSAAYMAGRINGFLAKMKEVAPDIVDISALHLDTALHRGLDKVQRLDARWGKVLQHEQYAPLKPATHACLSIFSGPRVESSFSVMNCIITSTTNRMHIKTYEAIHKIKYSLISHNTSSISLFHRNDAVYSQIDISLIYHIQTAHAKQQKVKGQKNQTNTLPKIPKRQACCNTSPLKAKSNGPIPHTVETSDCVPDTLSTTNACTTEISGQFFKSL
ncbi:hypothetical protein PoB_005097500 [Plakobranchus ocellatus]|uniref:DUF4371 domain-containing protein n=1 Tax=Plakobranchus ocellatus TaxID=259542 RepID=A0AAV4BYS7_9GAST|nr:hypothetical protein PoB_005097500 [Plakobranchus ocellatus]